MLTIDTYDFKCFSLQSEISNVSGTESNGFISTQSKCVCNGLDVVWEYLTLVGGGLFDLPH